MFNYAFPLIKTIDDVKDVLNKPEFICVKKDGYQVINYVYSDENTFTTPIEAECRGLIFDLEGKLLSRRYHKFFNVGERKDVIPDLSKPHRILEKLDGSMVSPLFLAGGIRWATKMGITDISMQVEEWVQDNQNYIHFCNHMNVCGFTPIFEWMSPENRIVLNYGKESRLVLTAVRETESGEYLDYFKLEYWCNEYDIPLVNKVNLPKYSNVVEYIRKQENMEGVVLRFLNGHMVKIKSEWYVKLHKTKADIASESKVLQHIIVDENIDDLIPLLCDEDKERVTKYQDQLFQGIISFDESLRNKFNLYRCGCETKKDFALKIKDLPYSNLLFKLWDNKESSVQVIIDHIKRNVKRPDSIRDIIQTHYKEIEV